MTARVLGFPAKQDPLDNVVTSRPLELRRAGWEAGNAILCLREESRKFEDHRREALADPAHRHIRYVPNHIPLTGPYHYTLMALLRFLDDEDGMTRVYRLAGCMECIMNVAAPVLRTDLVRRFHEHILEEQRALGASWRGGHRRFLFPLHSHLVNPNTFELRTASAGSLKELYDAIHGETDEQFLVLSKFYTIYLPGRFQE